MVFLNRNTRELNAKIVYVGPPSSGKSTNLRIIAERTKKEHVGDLITLDGMGARTATFDFLPLAIGRLRGYRTHLHLYTLPGSVPYATSRRMILKGVDALVFVADSDPAKVQENLECLSSLRKTLSRVSRNKKIPMVFQLNKRDLPHALPEDEMARLLGIGDQPVLPSVANTGQGVFDTLRSVSRLVLGKMMGSSAG